jgi:hypothetical protein
VRRAEVLASRGPVASNPYSIPPTALSALLESYTHGPDDLDAPSLPILARAFERMGCDQQALDCADRAARLDPGSKPEAVAVARKCVGRNSGMV